MFEYLPTDWTSLRAAIQGKEASSFESIRRGLTVSSPALAALDKAMLDLLGKFTNAPVYQVLGGPTRNQARALAASNAKPAMPSSLRSPKLAPPDTRPS